MSYVNEIFLRYTSRYGIERLIQQLEKDRKIYYKGEVMWVYKKVEKELKYKGYFD